jgi:hypothetical protein
MRKGLVTALLAGSLGFQGAGCGTLMFPERQHEDHSGRLDPNILILDGIGLLFFIVPGLVAFGIDLYTGAIYLPEGVDEGEGPFIHD